MRTIPSQLSRLLAWAAQAEKSGRIAWSLLLADALLYGLILAFVDGYWLGSGQDWQTAAILAGGVVLFHMVWLGYTRPPQGTTRHLVVKNMAAGSCAILLFPGAFNYLQIDLGRMAFATVVAVGTPLQILLHLAHHHWRRRVVAAPLEPLRWMLLACGGVLLGFPLLTNSKIGSGDAYWYGNMVADFVTQWRAGVFPVFVGQSDFAFNGAVSPVRFAPYLQHVAGILDLLTVHTLSFFGLVNLTLFFSLQAAAFATYASLVAIEKNGRWMACLLALLFVSSPAVLAPVYTGYLFLSICALPYLPLVMLGIWRTFQHQDTSSVCFLAAVLAAAWWCHPPIAFWATVIAGVSQMLRLIREGGNVRVWQGWLAGTALFLALTISVFVSALTLHLPALTAEPLQIVRSLESAYPGALLPVSEGANLLSDYQLGWSLWVILIAGGAITLFRPSAFRLALVLGIGLLLLLLLPIPHVASNLWLLLPQAVCNITFSWPMQRFYVLLAIMAVFLGYTALTAIPNRRLGLHLLVAGLLLVALAWSGSQALPFVRGGSNSTASAAESATSHLPQNRTLTRYAYNPFPVLPSYFSNSYVDPVWENRLLEPETFREIASNYGALAAGTAIIRDEGEVTARRYASRPTFYELFAALPIEPGRHYALRLELAHPELSGSLLITGSTLVSEYYLPDAGFGFALSQPSTAFGALPTSKRFLSLRSSSSQTEKLTVQFSSNSTVEYDIGDFGRFALMEYDPTQLPVVVESWTPYRATVISPAPAWLETPRIFIEGYHAVTNGKNVAIARSPNGLVMLPVGSGKNQVTLTYPGPLSLRLSYFLSLGAWISLIAAGLFRLGRG